MHITRKLAITAISTAALLSAGGGIAYANVTPTPTPSVTPTVTPSPTPLPNGCYRATDTEIVTARGHTPVVETVKAIVCLPRFGPPVVYVDTNANGFPFFR